MATMTLLLAATKHVIKDPFTRGFFQGVVLTVYLGAMLGMALWWTYKKGKSDGGKG